MLNTTALARRTETTVQVRLHAHLGFERWKQEANLGTNKRGSKLYLRGKSHYKSNIPADIYRLLKSIMFGSGCDYRHQQFYFKGK